MSILRVDNFAPSAGGTTYSARGVAKAWINFDGTGTVSIRDSENVSSLTDEGTGKYAVGFGHSFLMVDYAVALGGRKNDNNDDGNFSAATGNTTRVPSTTACPITTVFPSTLSLRDFPSVYLSTHGDLA